MESTAPQVYKSNALVEASYRLSLYEQRIILAAIAQVRHDESVSDQVRYRVSAQEIAEQTDTQLATAYQNLRAAAERLFERRATIYEQPNGGEPDEVITRWVQAVVYKRSEGAVEIRFANEMLPYLTQLTEQFTRYALSDVAKMTSGYAIRFYELIVQWRGTEKNGKGERLIEIEWLREALQLEDKFKLIGDLKRWVIEPSIKQINEHTPLRAEWEQRKTGRKITHILLTWREKPKPKSAQENENAKPKRLTRSYIEQNARPGETWEDAKNRLDKERRLVKQ